MHLGGVRAPVFLMEFLDVICLECRKFRNRGTYVGCDCL